MKLSIHPRLIRLLLLLLAAVSVTPSPAFPLKYTALRSGQDNPNVKPYMGRVAGHPATLLMAGGDTGPETATGSFNDSIPLTANEEVLASCLADVNGDGNDDFVAVLHDSTTAWNARSMASYRGTPSGFVLLYKMPFTSSNGPLYSRSQIVPADLDRDGDMDILLLEGWDSYATQSLSWFTNWATHTGRYDTETSIFSLPHASMEAMDLVVMHANLDDWPDILVADRLQDKIHVYLNNTAGGFTAGTAITENGPFRLFAFDVDRDGRKDLVSTSNSEDDTAPARLVWRKFQGLGFASPSIMDTQVAATSWYAGMTMADVTEDGVDDMVFVRTLKTVLPGGSWRYDSTVWYRTANPAVPGAFQGLTQITEMAASNQAIHSVAAGDVDHDGDVDLWFSRGSSSAWAELPILENIRPHGDSGAVVADFSGTSPAGVTSLALGDLNSDSWPDLVAAAAGTKAILWYAGGPNGTLAAPVTVSTGGLAPAFVSTGDIDSDGNVDLAWGITATGAILRSRNTNGSGTSWSTATVATLPGLNSLTMTNVNRDLDLDFLAGSSNGTVQWYYNSNNDGSFSTDTVLTQTGLARAVPLWLKTNARQQVVALSPLNTGNPGKVDLRDFFLLGTPPWTQFYTETGGVINASASATAGDFDRDGYKDCAWCAGSSVVKWRNVNLDATVTATVGTAPGIVRNLRSMDWNSDGWDDILCAHSTGVLVWTNTGGTSWKTVPLLSSGDCSDAIPMHLNAGTDMDVAAIDTTAGKLKLITHAAAAHVDVVDNKVEFGVISGEPSATPYVLVLDPTHLGLYAASNGLGGWHSDSRAVGERFRLRFVKAVQQPNGQWLPGAPLTQAELSASVEKVMIIDDTWGGLPSGAALDSPDDVILGEAAVSLTNGYQTVTASTNPVTYDGSVISPSGQSRRLYVALKIKSTVSPTTTGRFFVQHVTDPAQSGTRFATTEGTPARQLLNASGTPTTGQMVRLYTSYENWRYAWYQTYNNSGTAANNADNDGDGMNNVTEYILGKNPTVADYTPHLSMQPFGTTMVLYADLPPQVREDGIITLEDSASLTSWTTYATRTGEAPWTGAPYSTVFINGVSRTTFAPPAAGRKFYRLNFSLVP